MRAGLHVLDADAHVVEPFEVFSAWVDTDALPIDLPPTTPMIPCGSVDAIRDQLDNRFDAPSYLRAMDAQGIDEVVLYPSIGLFVPFQSTLTAAQSADACRSYNAWLADYCASGDGRMYGVGLVPQREPSLAVTVAEECAAAGLVGVLVRPNHLGGPHLGDPAYDGFYATLAAAGVILAVHEGLGLRGATIGSDRYDGFAMRHACSHPLEQMAALTGLLLGGVLERHPTLRVAVLESGTGWLPYWLSRIDEHASWMHETETRHLTMKPSEAFARQCVISTDPEDHLVDWTVSRVGADHVVWASDFPHPDALFPTAVDEFVAGSGLSRPDLQAVLWDTPRRFYGLP
jgi:predicted TIM-barrel fold metal-dependent hydrolase